MVERVAAHGHPFSGMTAADRIETPSQADYPGHADTAFEDEISQEVVDALKVKQGEFLFRLIGSSWLEQLWVGHQRRPSGAVAGPAGEVLVVERALAVQGSLQIGEVGSTLLVEGQVIQGPMVALDLGLVDRTMGPDEAMLDAWSSLQDPTA